MSIEIKSTFFERLSTRRLPGETLDQFAVRLGVPIPTMRRWNVGVRPTDGNRYLELAELLGVRPQWLAFGEEPKEPSEPSAARA